MQKCANQHHLVCEQCQFAHFLSENQHTSLLYIEGSQQIKHKINDLKLVTQTASSKYIMVVSSTRLLH